jgi:hypothetical protein
VRGEIDPRQQRVQLPRHCGPTVGSGGRLFACRQKRRSEGGRFGDRMGEADQRATGCRKTCAPAGLIPAAQETRTLTLGDCPLPIANRPVHRAQATQPLGGPSRCRHNRRLSLESHASPYFTKCRNLAGICGRGFAQARKSAHLPRHEISGASSVSDLDRPTRC